MTEVRDAISAILDQLTLEQMARAEWAEGDWTSGEWVPRVAAEKRDAIRGDAELVPQPGE